MKNIGIITAMDEEFKVVEELMTDITEEKIYNLKLLKGKINNKKVILVKCGIGKVNSARTTQILIDKFEIEYIINVGVAGSLNDKLEIGDIVIGEKLVQHDFDTTGFGDERGYITGAGKEFLSNQNLINKSKDIIDNSLIGINAIIGTIATGDIFCNNIELKNAVVKEFNADCIEMEGASIAQVCTLDNIPFVVIRSISDKPNGNNGVDFQKYLVQSAKNYQSIIKLII